LWGGVGAGKTEVGAVRCQKRCESLVDELSGIISLNPLYRKAELGAAYAKKPHNVIGYFRFVNHGKSAAKVSVIVEDD
jgi:hypothetical protein